MDNKALLVKIGLSENEAEVYLCLLSAGPSSASEIAKKTGIYRPHVYDKIGTLLKKGLVSFAQMGRKKIFSASPPSKIVDYLKEQEEELKKDRALLAGNLVQLNSFFNQPKEDTAVQVFNGIEGLKFRLYDTWRHAEKEVLIFGLDELNYQQVLPTFMPQHFKRLKEKGVKERVITQKKKGAFVFDNKVSDYRFLDSGQVKVL